jgi:hypothetical protein
VASDDETEQLTLEGVIDAHVIADRDQRAAPRKQERNPRAAACVVVHHAKPPRPIALLARKARTNSVASRRATRDLDDLAAERDPVAGQSGSAAIGIRLELDARCDPLLLEVLACLGGIDRNFGIRTTSTACTCASSRASSRASACA